MDDWIPAEARVWPGDDDARTVARVLDRIMPTYGGPIESFLQDVDPSAAACLYAVTGLPPREGAFRRWSPQGLVRVWPGQVLSFGLANACDLARGERCVRSVAGY